MSILHDTVWRVCGWSWWSVFFFQAEDGIRDLVRSRGLGDVYKRQEGVGLAGLSASVPGLHAVDLAGRRFAQPGGHA